MPSPPPPAIGWPAFVAGFRAHVGEPQVVFAECVGVRPATVSAWETDDHAPRGVMVSHLCRLAEAAGYAGGTPPVRTGPDGTGSDE